MAVDLFGVLLLQTEDDLRGDDALVRVSEAELRVEREGRRVLEEVRGDVLLFHSALHNPVLVDTFFQEESVSHLMQSRNQHSNETAAYRELPDSRGLVG